MGCDEVSSDITCFVSGPTQLFYVLYSEQEKSPWTRPLHHCVIKLI